MAILDFLKKGKKKEPVKAPTPKKVEQASVAPEAESMGPEMAAPKSSTVLKSFHVSEKATRNIGLNQYTFIIDTQANKSQVRDAVERSYNVKVDSVKVLYLPEKERRVGLRVGTSAMRKKAVVILKPGHSIAAAQP